MSALTKYSGIWAGYETYYDTMERVQEVKQKKGELQALNEQSEWPLHLRIIEVYTCLFGTDTSMQARIQELEETLKAILARKGNRYCVIGQEYCFYCYQMRINH